MKNAFLFPGQGSQFVGMAADLYKKYAQAKDLFNEADEIMGMSLSEIAFNGPEDKLRQTQYTQPAIFVHSVIAYEITKDAGLIPDAVAGHSLGEYSALVSAGGLEFEDAMALVKLRGELMQHAGEIQPGTMAAVIGIENSLVNEVCEKVDGVVVPANYNCPGQLVISGSVEAVHEAMQKMKEAGARIVKELVVSGAFHSPLMKEAIKGLEEALMKAPIKDTQIPIYQNVDAKPETKADIIREKLLSQLTSPVNWHGIIENMLSDQIDSFYEIGPGNVLKGLLKRIDRSKSCLTLGTDMEFAHLAE